MKATLELEHTVEGWLLLVRDEFGGKQIPVKITHEDAFSLHQIHIPIISIGATSN